MKSSSIFILSYVLSGSFLIAPSDSFAQQEAPPLTSSSSQALSSSAFSQKATNFIKDLGDRALSLLTSKTITEVERKSRFKVLFHENFAEDAIGKFCLGRYWRVATEEEQKEYLNLFDDSIANSYASKFAQYDPQEVFKVIGSRAKEDGGIVVKSSLTKPGEEALTIDWIVYDTPKGSRIFDVIVAGVSMSVSQRSEYASIIQRTGGNVSGLIQAFKDKKISAAS